MKRKLLLAALCVVGALGFKAQAQQTYTTSDLTGAGWTLVTANSITESSENYYVLVDANSSNYVMSADATHYRPCYKTIADPVENPSFVWILEENGGKINLKSYATGAYFKQDSGWNTSVGDGRNGSVANLTFTLSDGKYSIQCDGQGLVGHWNDDGAAVKEDGENIAANKNAANAPGFYLYSISRATFDAALLSAREEYAATATETSPFDVTAWIQNADWSNDWGAWEFSCTSSGNIQWGQKTLESWNANNVIVKQELRGVPNGKYKVTADLISGPGAAKAAYVFGIGSSKVSSSVVSKDASANNYNTMSSEVAGNTLTAENIVVTNNTLTVGVDQSTGWIVADNFKLYYYGEDLSIYVNAYNEAVEAAEAIDQEAPMLATVLSALQSALSSYGTGVDTSDKDALLEATSALGTATTNARTSIEAYAKATTAIEKANTLKTAHNFASSEAITTFAEAIAAIQTPYNAGTLSNEDANTAASTLGMAVTGWHAGNTTPAAVYLRDGFGLADFVADPALHVNTWSTEGDGDGSNFSVPFYESWTSNENTLPQETLTGTLTNLDNGLYSVSAWVRVRTQTGVTATNATGITMDVNGGTAKDVTEGDQVGETQFTIKEYTAEGLVKDGILKVNFNVAENTNISWLSFKNVKYTKVRDLTEEEMAVAPTAIALKNGEEVVTEIALNATNASVTLTPSYTPANATEGYLTWTSSDATVATVANGVVKGISSGTATITATSTLDATVFATATVTVTYPESTVPEYANDDATRYVHHYGENLIKNGTFEYPNPFQGWKSGANGNCDANNFNIVTDGDSKYIQAKGSQGAGDSHSISTGWAIEAGKTYIFGYKVKASKAGTMQFLVTSLTNTIGTETAQLDTENERKAKAVTTSWTDVKYEFTNSDNYAYVQFRARWMADSQSFDDFYLVEKTAEDDVIGNVDYATAAIPTANIGTGAFQYSQDAIDAANALVQGTATVAEVEEAYDALTTLNAPEAGKVYNIVNITPNFAYNGKALTFKSASDADLTKNTTSMGWLEEPSSIYPQGVKFTAVENVKNGYKMSYTRADGNEVYVSTGKTSGLGNSTQQIRPTTDATKALTVEIQSAGEGKWYLYNTEDAHCMGSNGDTGFYTAGGSNKDVKIQEAVNNEVTLNISSANKYGTFIIPFDAEIPTGVKAYTVTGTSGEWMTISEASEFKANTPYFVEAESGVNKTLAGIGSAYTDATYTKGQLTGVYTSTTATAGTYVLQNIEGTVAFYEVEEDKEPTVVANRAYLTATSTGAANVRAFFFPTGEATGIDAIGVLTSGNYDAIYTAGGVKVNALQKGLNIVVKDGKSHKIYVK